MSFNEKRPFLWIGFCFFFVLTLVVFWKAADVFFLIFAGAIIALALRSIRNFLYRRFKIPAYVASSIVGFGFVSMVIVSLVVFVPLVQHQFEGLFTRLPSALGKLKEAMEKYEITRPYVAQINLPETWVGLGEKLGESLLQRVSGLFSATFGVIGNVFITLISGIYFTVEPDLYRHGFLRMFPIKSRERMTELLDELAHSLKWWLFGQSISMIILGITTTVILWMFDVPLALLLGIFTAAMTFIPNLGPIIAGVPALLMALTVSPMTMVYVLIFYTILQNIEGALITPYIHRRIVALPPVLVIGMQVVLASIVGFVGVFMAMPLLVCIIVSVQVLYVKHTLGDDMKKPLPY